MQVQVIKSYNSDEFMVFNSKLQKIGFFFERDNAFEAYSDFDAEDDEFVGSKLCNNQEEALQFIVDFAA